MAKTGAKFRRCNVEQAEAHNRRRKAYTEALKKKYGQTHYREELTHLNLYWDNSEYKGMSLAKIERQAAAEAKAKTGRKMQEKASPIREACPPIKPDTKIEDFDNFKLWLATKGIKVISIDLHHDEGHYDKDTNEWVPNHHAHIIVDWFDHATGKAVRLTPLDCKEMQSALAESLGMERGTPKEDTGIEGLSATEFKLKKAKEELKDVNENIKNAKEVLNDTNEKVKVKRNELEVVLEEVASMSTTKAVKEKVLGLFKQSSKDNEIRELKGEIAKVNAAKADDSAKFQQLLEEEAKKRRNLENRIRQLEKDKIEAVEKEQNSIVNTIILPFMNDVWNTLDGISGEDTPPPIDILSFYSALSQRLKSTLDVTLPKIKKDARKEGSITYQNNTIWPWIKGLWQTINELTGESADLPKKLSDLRHGLSDRLHQVNTSIDERIKLERQDALQKYKKETVEPNYLQQQNTITQQEKNLAEKNKEVSELHTKNKNMEKLLDAIGLSHPVIKEAYDAIYSLSTTSSARRFTSIQASNVDKAISLASDPSQRSSIAQWLLDQVWKAVGKSPTYSAWYKNNAYPETMTIANGEGKRGSRNRGIQR